MQRYRLEYAGIAKSWTFDLYNGQRVTLSKTNRVFLLPASELSQDAIKYYKSLAPQVKLLRTGSVQANKQEPVKAKEDEVIPTQKEVKSFSAVEEKPVLPKEIVEEITVVKKTDSDEKESDYIVGDKNNAEETFETDQITKDSFSEADLCEHLDMNMSEEELREMAEELGVNVKRLRSKDSIIARIVNEKFDEVLAKLKI